MRFVIITLPPPAIRDEVEALRRPLNEAVGAREALRYPPHLTLRTGLVCPDDRADEVARAFLAFAAPLNSVGVQTQGLFFTTYGPPANERGMVGWSVAVTPGLWELHRGLLGFTDWAKGVQGEFRPHVTLAFDDLRVEDVETLRQRLAASPSPVPEFSWTIDHVALYFEGREGWLEWDRTALKSSPPL